MKCYYPDAFCAAILNAQPMGFHAPAQLIRDADEHGVAVRSVDVNLSDWYSHLEPCAPDGSTTAAISPRHASMAGVMKNTHAVRLGFHRIKGFGEDDAERLTDAGRTSRYPGQQPVRLTLAGCSVPFLHRIHEHVVNGASSSWTVPLKGTELAHQTFRDAGELETAIHNAVQDRNREREKIRGTYDNSCLSRDPAMLKAHEAQGTEPGALAA